VGQRVVEPEGDGVEVAVEWLFGVVAGGPAEVDAADSAVAVEAEEVVAGAVGISYRHSWQPMPE
jgi:hypothetical protein